MEQTLNIPVTCPQCNKEMVVKVNTTDIDPLLLAPEIRGGVKPVGIPYEYHVSSEDIKRFIIDKIHQYSPNANVKISVRYCEKKRRKDNELHKSYATFLIALSHHVIEDYNSNGWFEKLGENNGKVHIVNDLYVKLIKQWKYDPDYISEWLKSYKKLERLEEGLGMTEAFINEIKEFSVPRSTIANGTDEAWVFFMPCPEKIIADFFTNVKTNKIAGKLEVKDIVKISKDIVEYTVSLDPYAVVTKENPYVRQILNGEAKL